MSDHSERNREFDTKLSFHFSNLNNILSHIKIKKLSQHFIFISSSLFYLDY